MEASPPAADVNAQHRERLERVQILSGSTYHIHYGPEGVPLDVSIGPTEDTYDNGTAYHLEVQRPPLQRQYPTASVFAVGIKKDGALGGSFVAESGLKAMQTLFGYPRGSEQIVDDLLAYLGQSGSSLPPAGCDHGPTAGQALGDLGVSRAFADLIASQGKGGDDGNAIRLGTLNTVLDDFEARARAAVAGTQEGAIGA